MAGAALPGSLHAQTDLASISGTITDSAGARITGSSATALNKATGASRLLTTGADGFYSFPSLPTGTYTVTATASGFATASTTVDLMLSGVTANLSLTVGSTTSTINVWEHRKR